MHTVLEGVVKGMFRLWFSPDFAFTKTNEREKKKRNLFSMRQYIDQIDDRLLKIKPPSFVPAAPRSIDSWSLWRAHEFLYFIIYYSLCVFHEIMEYEYYQHLMLLVIAIENLLKPKIKRSELQIIHQALIKFVEQFEELYPERSMLSGVHELLHLVRCTENFGPLNGCCCFEFEELNRLFLKLIKGNDLIGEEFIKLYSFLTGLNTFCSATITDSKFKQFIIKNAAIKSSNLKINRNNNYGQVIGNNDIIKEQMVSDLLQDYGEDYIEDLVIYFRAEYNSIKYTTMCNDTRFCDYCVVSNDTDFGFIKYFIKKEDAIFVLCQRIIKLRQPFYYDAAFKNYRSLMFICDISNEYFITKLEAIKKVCYIKVEDVSFISTFRGSHLFS